MGTRSRMCHGGWEVWVHRWTLLLYVMSELIWLGLWYHNMCVVEIICTVQIYTYPIHIQCAMCNTIQEYGFCRYRFINLFKLLLYFTVILNEVKHSKI